LGRDEVRIAYILNEQDLEKAMDCLEVALEAYKAVEAAMEAAPAS
jgi:aspartate aminotransferase